MHISQNQSAKKEPYVQLNLLIDDEILTLSQHVQRPELREFRDSSRCLVIGFANMWKGERVEARALA